MTHSENNTNIVFRGGSIPSGKGVLRSYVEVVRDRITARNVVIHNRSRAGDSSFEGVNSFNDDIAQFKPDMLFLHFGIDDIYRPVYRSEFKENLVQLVRLSRKLFDPDIFLLTSHPFEDRFEMDSALIYYRAIREVALDLSCTLVPVHLLWLGYLQDSQRKISEYLQTDIRLPNEAGHFIYADIIYQIISGIV